MSGSLFAVLHSLQLINTQLLFHQMSSLWWRIYTNNMVYILFDIPCLDSNLGPRPQSRCQYIDALDRSAVGPAAIQVNYVVNSFSPFEVISYQCQICYQLLYYLTCWVCAFSVLKPCCPLLVMSTLFSVSRFLTLCRISLSKIFEAEQRLDSYFLTAHLQYLIDGFS